MSEVEEYLEAYNHTDALSKQLKEEGEKYITLGELLKKSPEQMLCSPQETTNHPVTMYAGQGQDRLGPFKPMPEIAEYIRAYMRAVKQEYERYKSVPEDMKQHVPKPHPKPLRN